MYCSFAASVGQHITGLTWTTTAGVDPTGAHSVVGGIETAPREGCSTDVERFFSGGLSGASVSLLRGGAVWKRSDLSCWFFLQKKAIILSRQAHDKHKEKLE